MKSKMYLVQQGEVLDVLDKLNVEVEYREDEVAILDDGKQASCEACHTKLNITNLGHIEKGSTIFYCDNPACFSHFVAKRRLWKQE